MTKKELREENKRVDAINPSFRKFHQEQRREKIKKVLSKSSGAILWVCAVGGFVLSLINFFQN